MKKVLHILSVLFCFATGIVAQDGISTVFLTMPESIIPSLAADQKYTLIATLKDSGQVVAETPIHPDIVRTALSDDYIALKTSEAGTTQVKLLPLINNSKIVCVVKTVKGGFSDSRVSFYTTDWQPIAKGDLLPQTKIDWFVKADADRSSQEFVNAFALLDILPVVITMSGNSTTLSLDLDAEGYLSEEDYKRIEPFLIDGPKVLKWDRVSFKAE